MLAKSLLEEEAEVVPGLIALVEEADQREQPEAAELEAAEKELEEAAVVAELETAVE